MYLIKGNNLRISVRNLVEFICCSGDIDNRTGGMSDVKAMQEGIRLHKKIQKSMGPSYKAEVPLKLDILVEHEENYVITLEGRADGIICDFDEDEDGNKIPLSDVTIDEIKTTSSDVSKMMEPQYVHKAQALCYAYIFMVENELESINIQLTYCNVEHEYIKRFNEQYSFEMLFEWFQDMIGKFEKWTDFIFESKKTRQISIRNLEFPFEYRKGQRKLVAGVYRTIENKKNLYIQAPTGVGKTIASLFPAVRAIGEDLGDKIFYLTAKTITRTVAEDTFKLLRSGGLKFRTATITAKDKVCILEKRECNPDACICAKGHYDRVNDAVYDLVTHEYCIDRDKITEYALKHNVCPFEMSLDVTYWCDGIICDYNYVFDPNVRLKRYFAEGSKGEYVFLIDEAHNLVDRAISMYSADLCKEDFLEVKKILKGIDKKLDTALEKSNKAMLELKRECDDYQVITSTSHFVMGLERLFYQMQKFNEEHRNFEPKEKVTEFYLKVRHFLNMYEILDDKYITYMEHADDGKFYIHLYCVDPSGNISNCISQGNSTIFFSATLLPISYFKEMLTGNIDDNAIYAETPFDSDMRRLIIANDVSSKYTRRGTAEYKKICGYINEITEGRKGNYLVFFPSYSFMETVYAQMVSLGYKETGTGETRIILQGHSMNEREREEFLDNFEINEKNRTLIGFCVMGGIFSEGIDLKNDSLIGALIVGTGLPMICNERQLLRSYFDENRKNGYEYAYVYPGMNKVLQAAGRVIRTEEDRGIIALLDERFLNRDYQKLFPREWDSFYQVNQNTVGEIAKEFWE